MKLSDLVPTNWLDPLLTGPDAALPEVGKEVKLEHVAELLRRLKARIQEAEHSRVEADRDGDRYRWIKRHARHIEIATLTQMFGMGPTDLDRVLDTAMKQDCPTSPQEGK